MILLWFQRVFLIVIRQRTVKYVLRNTNTRKWKERGKNNTFVFNQNGAAGNHEWIVCCGQKKKQKKGQLHPLLFSKHQRSLREHPFSFLSFFLSVLAFLHVITYHPVEFKHYTRDYRQTLGYNKRGYLPQMSVWNTLKGPDMMFLYTSRLFSLHHISILY